jgi:hypothetical protein
LWAAVRTLGNDQALFLWARVLQSCPCVSLWSFTGLYLLPGWLHQLLLEMEERNYILWIVWHERWEDLFALAYGIMEE